MTLFAVLFSFCFCFILLFLRLCLALFFGFVYLLMYQFYLLLLLSLLLLFSLLLLLLLLMLWLYNAQWLNLTVDNISRCQPFECVNVPCLMLRSISICCRLLFLFSVVVVVVFVVVCRVCISYKLTIQLAFYNTNTHTTCQTYRHWPEVCVCKWDGVMCVCLPLSVSVLQATLMLA